MKPSVIALGVAVAGAALVLSGAAEARNPHCAGGIQYVVQAMRDKEKGNTGDYQREINKAVQQLEMCAAEDANDAEALGYLGWAYAEVDSTCKGGRAFTDAITKLQAKGDKKKADWVRNNRDSYWAIAFNEGIARINAAQGAYPSFSKKPEGAEEESHKNEAAKNYQAAITSLIKASCLRPDDPRTMRNLGAVYGFMGDFQKAEATFREGLKVAPADSDLTASLSAVLVNRASQLVDAEKYDEAIASFTGLIKDAPSDMNLRIGLADAHFKRAQGREGDARKQDFKAAGDAYAKAGELKPESSDLFFNAALAYQNAGEWAKAEGMWRAVLKLKPDDVDALSSLGSVLAELGKFDESIRVLHQAVTLDPKNKSLHRQLGAAYTKAGNNGKATEELMVFLALQNGQPVADAGAEAKKAGGAAAKTLASMGAPEQVYRWDADNEKYETWFYWAKRAGFHFKSGTLVQKSDWGAPDVKTASSGGK